MNIQKATEKYEAWLSKHLRIVEPDLQFKHEQMRSAAFPFLRATYYRWAQIWTHVCEDAARAPRVLAVGDLHVENFGTWRDIEGRLIWGINDFDEVWRLPYTNDLIRLAASALMAQITCDEKTGMIAIVDGYREALEAGGRPYVLAEHHPSLRHMATARLHDPEPYWAKLHALQEVAEPGPATANKALGCGAASRPTHSSIRRCRRGSSRSTCGISAARDRVRGGRRQRQPSRPYFTDGINGETNGLFGAISSQ